jgi:hypothetical protein
MSNPSKFTKRINTATGWAMPRQFIIGMKRNSNKIGSHKPYY